jgi:hypothetical protein
MEVGVYHHATAVLPSGRDVRVAIGMEAAWSTTDIFGVVAERKFLFLLGIELLSSNMLPATLLSKIVRFISIPNLI